MSVFKAVVSTDEFLKIRLSSAFRVRDVSMHRMGWWVDSAAAHVVREQERQSKENPPKKNRNCIFPTA